VWHYRVCGAGGRQLARAPALVTFVTAYLQMTDTRTDTELARTMRVTVASLWRPCERLPQASSTRQAAGFCEEAGHDMSQMVKIEGLRQKLSNPFRILCIFGTANKDDLERRPRQTKHAGEPHAIQFAASKIESGHQNAKARIRFDRLKSSVRIVKPGCMVTGGPQR
jgi:hypothetical protein